MNRTVSSHRKIRAALIGLGVVCMILIAGVIISLTSKNEIAGVENFTDEPTRWSQKVTEHSDHPSDAQIEEDIQNSMVYLQGHIRESEKRLDEHVQRSQERFEKLIGKE